MDAPFLRHDPSSVTFARAAIDNAVQRAALALTRDIRIRARVTELRRLAERTAGGELPVPNDDPPQHGDHQ
jgi:hypothetical protein